MAKLRQDDEHRERQGNIELRSKGISPISQRVLVFEIKFANGEIEDSEQIGDKSFDIDYPRHDEGETKEKINASRRADEAVYVSSRMVIDVGAELPYGDSRDKGEEQREGQSRANDTPDDD